MENTQTKAKFDPTAEQLAFAQAYVTNMGSIRKACEEIGDASRNKYYSKPNGWKYQEGFEIWLSGYAKEEVLKRSGRWYLIAEKFAEKGSFQHLNLLMQIKREFAPGPLVETHTHYNLISSLHQSAKEYTENGDGAGANNRIKDSLRVD